MKICSKCGVAKDETEFFVKDNKLNRLHAQCKLCYKVHRKNYYTAHYTKYKHEYLLRAKLRREKLRSEFRTNMLKYMSDKACVVCGEADIRVLELDHINPKDKSFSVSQAVKLGHNWSEVLTELEKCQVLCANCHKRRTAQQFNWYKSSL
jgi:5-methylcytosine-specific restriction endonuclease McrA